MDYSKYFKYKQEEQGEKARTERDIKPEAHPDSEKKRFKSLLLVVLGGLLIILYVSNVIAVKGLLKEVYILRKQSEKITDGNQILKAKINKLESPERITAIAKEKFGMIKPDYPPVSLPQIKDSIR